MELSTLRNFLEVARLGNITRAAEQLHIAQPSLSRQIKQLEDELGQKLFLRKHYRVELTAAGKTLLERATEIVRLSDLAVSELASKNKQLEGELSIALADGTFSESVPEVIDSFRNAFPGIRMSFYSGGLLYIDMLIKKHIPDIVCQFTGFDPKRLNFVKTDHIKKAGLVMRSDDPLAQQKELSSEMYSNVNVIYPRGILYDENYKDINLDIPEDRIMLMAEEPMVFLDLIRRSGAYIFCLEPSNDTLRRYDLCFRPIVPYRRASLYFVQMPEKEPTEAVTAFMDYIDNFYKPRTC